MSADSVDDLHGAEDRIGEMENALQDIAIIFQNADPELFAETLDAVQKRVISAGFGQWSGGSFLALMDEPWCRPTCGGEGYAIVDRLGNRWEEVDSEDDAEDIRDAHNAAAEHEKLQPFGIIDACEEDCCGCTCHG